jgi:hypothetical protein
VKAGPPGRWHLVVQDSLREFQAPFVDIKGEPERLIEWATRGGKALPDVPAMMLGLGGGGAGNVDTHTSEAVPQGVSLREFADLESVDLAWLRRQVERRPEAPQAVTEGANRTRLYNWGQLSAFVAERLKEGAEEVA